MIITEKMKNIFIGATSAAVGLTTSKVVENVTDSCSMGIISGVVTGSVTGYTLDNLLKDKKSINKIDTKYDKYEKFFTQVENDRKEKYQSLKKSHKDLIDKMRKEIDLGFWTEEEVKDAENKYNQYWNNI